MKTSYFTLTLLAQPWLVMLFLAAGYATTAMAAKEKFERVKPHVNVGSTGTVSLDSFQFDFSANVKIFSDGHAGGAVKLRSHDGTVVQNYRAVAGAVRHAAGEQTYLAFQLVRASDHPMKPDSVAIALAQPNPQVDDCIMWEVIGSNVQQIIQFEVPGFIELIGKGEYESQLTPDANLNFPAQIVEDQISGERLGFHSQMLVSRTEAAGGLIEFLPLDGTGRTVPYEPLFGTVIPESETGPIYIILFVLPLGSTSLDALVTATVSPSDGPPHSYIWVFNSYEPSGTDNPVGMQFHAIGEIGFTIGRGNR